MKVMVAWGRAQGARVLAGGALALMALSCGELVSWDERWIFDGGEHGSSGSSGEPASPVTCTARPIEGYGYAEPPEQWPGWRETVGLRVDGQGYLAVGSVEASARRFFRATTVAAADDGTLVHGDQPLLGFPPDATPEQCLVELRLPSASPARATSSVEMLANFDSRAPVTTFDLTDPSGSSSTSISFSVFDAAGVTHRLDVYAVNRPHHRVEYHVLADGSELSGGAPGSAIEIGGGWLQFDDSGALAEARTPTVYVAFGGTTAPAQGIDLSWGSAVGDDAGPGSTFFAVAGQVFTLTIDGRAAGAGAGFYVDESGSVIAYFDNGEGLPIGTVALARFAHESALAPQGDGWAATAESGDPEYGAPLSGGRGAVLIGAP